MLSLTKYNRCTEVTNTSGKENDSTMKNQARQIPNIQLDVIRVNSSPNFLIRREIKKSAWFPVSPVQSPLKLVNKISGP